MSAAETVSRNVRRLRRARGWTQAEAGQRIATVTGGAPWSVAVWSVSEKTDGKRQRSWTADDLAALAELFGVSIGELFGDCCTQCDGEPPVGFTCNSCGGVR